LSGDDRIRLRPSDGPLHETCRGLAAGAHVELAPGVYRGPLILDKDISICAAGSTGSATIQASRGATVRIEGAERVRMSGLLLRGPMTGLGAVMRAYALTELELVDCIVTGGRGEGEGGGGLDVQHGLVTLQRCRFTNNLGLQGGGLRAAGPVLVRARNSVFAGNRSEGLGGGAVFAHRGATVQLCGCTFAANLADHGSALLSGRGGTGGRIEATNCLFAATQEGLAVAVHEPGRLHLSHSVVPAMADSLSEGVEVGDGTVQKRVPVHEDGVRFAPLLPAMLSGLGRKQAFEEGERGLYGKLRTSVAVGAVAG